MGKTSPIGEVKDCVVQIRLTEEDMNSLKKIAKRKRINYVTVVARIAIRNYILEQTA